MISERKKFFAAFIMTYRRNSTLETTIAALFKQTYPPEKVVIVDNDIEFSAKPILELLPNYPLEYYNVGYNSGPAGASRKGLEILTAQEYKWIAWVDDDDPPVFDNCFELLLQVGENAPNCGCVGAVGHYFDRRNGIITRVPDDELLKPGIIEVDQIAGGMCKIVASKVVSEKNILPDEKLFFSFEDLDFDLKIQNGGYKLYASRNLYLNHRTKFKTQGIVKQRGNKKDTNKLWRDYYSTRNILFILSHNKLTLALIKTLFRSGIKVFLGFRFGLHYGTKNAQYIFRAILDFSLNKKGQIHL
jgi:GT2 family glycosyltransferase